MPRALLPEAQAVETAKLGPVAVRSRAISAAAMLGTLRVMARGEMSSGRPAASLANSVT